MTQVGAIFNSFLLETFTLFLLSVGFFLIHRIAKFLNIAHGDYASLGAFLIWTLVSLAGLNIWVAMVISIVVIGLVAISIDRVSYKYLRSSPLALLLCSMGIGFIVRYGIFMIWGARFKKIAFALPNFEVLGMAISGSLIFTIAAGCLVMLIIYSLSKYTALGISARAMADNATLAESFGIDTEKTLKFVWFLSGCSAALGGVALTLYQPLTFEMGFEWILMIISVSILAGERVNLPLLLGACGIITAGMELGLFFIPESYRMGVGFVILVIAILVRRVLKK